MTGRELWLDAGLTALAENGARGVTIDNLSARLALSKGSFYHHFKGMKGFKTALLQHFEAVCTTRFIDAVEQEGRATARVKLEKLLEMVLREHAKPGDADLEIAMRAWAQQDPVVRAAQARVDHIRVEYLRDLWRGLSGSVVEASRMGQLLYLLLIGAGHVIPPLSAEELRQLYDLVLRSAPAARKRPRSKLTSTRRTR